MEWGLFWVVVCAWGAALCWFDVRERRLPNLLTVPAAGLAFTAAAWSAVDGAPSALLGALLWTGLYGAAFLFRGLGAGDVKLAPALGTLVGGCAGVPATLLAILAAQLVTLGWVAIARDRTVPHGPAMILPALALGAFG